MILLDTNALIWIDRGHPRVRPLLRGGGPLYVSPATILELQFLLEAGKIRLRSGSVQSFVGDDRWLIDEPPATDWFLRSLDLSWTRDPFEPWIADGKIFGHGVFNMKAGVTACILATLAIAAFVPNLLRVRVK